MSATDLRYGVVVANGRSAHGAYGGTVLGLSPTRYPVLNRVLLGVNGTDFGGICTRRALTVLIMGIPVPVVERRRGCR
eukprot:2308929-Rhodomonas_salina.1